MMRDLITLLEGFGTYTEVEFVCINPSTGGSDPEKVRVLHDMMTRMPGLLVVRQDFMEEAGHLAMVAIIMEDAMVSRADIERAAKKAGVEIDVVRQINDRIVDDIYAGTYENMVDAINTSSGQQIKGVCWSAQSVNEGKRPVDAFLKAVNEIGKEYYRFSDHATFRSLNGAIVRLDAYGPSEANLMEISTFSQHRQQGHGTALLQQVCVLADRYGITLYGNAYPIRKAIYDLPMKQEPLTAWYLKHGFEIAEEPAQRGVNIVRKPK